MIDRKNILYMYTVLHIFQIAAILFQKFNSLQIYELKPKSPLP